MGKKRKLVVYYRTQDLARYFSENYEENVDYTIFNYYEDDKHNLAGLYYSSMVLLDIEVCCYEEDILTYLSTRIRTPEERTTSLKIKEEE